MNNELSSNWRPRVKRFALDLRLVEGHTDYTRFIVLGRSRTGSNLLRGLLNSHPQIVVFGELFSNYEEVDWAYPGYQQTNRMLAHMHRDPVGFLDEEVYGRFPLEIAAVGFKIFYYHAQENGWERIWERLQADQSIRVLHIKRRNMLKTHLSRKRAVQSGVWTDTSGSSTATEPVTLDFEECLEDFQRTRRWEEEYDARFANHPHLEIMYEELARNFESEMRRVQEFLRVPYRPLQPETRRQSSEPLRQAIANYDELKTRFIGSPWEAFFEG